MIKARKNKVEIIKRNGKYAVRKIYCRGNLAPNLYYTALLEGKLPVAKLIYSKGSTCVYEYFGDKTLLDFLEMCEKENETEIFLRKAEKVIDYLKTFYEIVNSNSTYEKETNEEKSTERCSDAILSSGRLSAAEHIVLNDVNFRNFVFSGETAACVDFDNAAKGSIIAELASFIAYLLTYDPIATDFKKKLAYELKEYILKKFGLNNRLFLPFVYGELEKINSRREKKANAILLTNCLLSSIVICPDSFKGTLTAYESAKIIGSVVKEFANCTELISIPMADGGEGTLECFKRFTNGRYVTAQTTDSTGKSITARYLRNGKYAVIESAEAVGLDRFKGTTPEKTTTFGIGELIADAVENKAERIYLAIGGTSTNDLGVGIASRLGVRFFDKTGEFLPTGESLSRIISIDTRNVKNIDIVCMCDVKNPLLGKFGSAEIYSRQKGATDDIVAVLEKNAHDFDDFLVESNMADADIKFIEGVGAGGGIPYSLIVFFDAKIESGIKSIIELSDFKSKAKKADLIITGEGKLDEQSFMGKVADGILQSVPKGKKVVAIAGKVAIDRDKLTEKGVYYAISVNEAQIPIDKLKLTAKDDLRAAAEKLFCTVKLF